MTAGAAEEPAASATPGPEALRTGHADLDRALAELAGLDRRPLAEHHDRLSAAYERLHDLLHEPVQEPGRSSVPDDGDRSVG